MRSRRAYRMLSKNQFSYREFYCQVRQAFREDMHGLIDYALVVALVTLVATSMWRNVALSAMGTFTNGFSSAI
jgi:hypothetical protein